MANQYDKGDLVRVAVSFKDINGVLTDPTTITVKIRDSLGTVTTWVYGTNNEVVKDSTGVYHADKLIDKSGIWQYKWLGTGTITAAEESSFVVKNSFIE